MINSPTAEPLDETLLSFFVRRYRPLRLPGDSEKRKATVAAYRSAISSLSKILERQARLSDLNDRTIAEVMALAIDQGLSVASANRILRHTKAVWKFARDHCELPLPACKTKPMREPKHEPIAWTPEDLEAIIRTTGTMRGRVGGVKASTFWRALLLTQISTGLRIRCLYELPIASYDRERREILAPAEIQKQRAEQWLELLDSAAEAIETLAPWKRGKKRLFGDFPFKLQTLSDHLKRLLVAAGMFDSVEAIPKRRHGWHKFRRTFATQVAATAGKDAARELLGHSCLAVTERYLDRRLMPRPSISELIIDPTMTDPPPTTIQLFREADAG